MGKLEAYHKRLNYSYALGVYPSHRLIEARPDQVTRLLLHPDGLHHEGIEKLRSRCAELHIREEMAERALRRESKKENCYAALVFSKYAAPLDAEKPHVVLTQISDGGNLGTALRACLGFGIRDVAVIKPCVDIFDPRVLRASMGAFFPMNVRAYDDFDAYRRDHPDHALYPFLLDGAVPVHEAAGSRPDRFALVFGNEQTGLPAAFSDVGNPVFIPQSDEIDSLNLAVAVAVGAYAFTAGR